MRQEKKEVRAIVRQAEQCKVEKKEKKKLAGRVIKLNYKMQKNDYTRCRENSIAQEEKKGKSWGDMLDYILPLFSRQNAKHVRNRYIRGRNKIKIRIKNSRWLQAGRQVHSMHEH